MTTRRKREEDDKKMILAMFAEDRDWTFMPLSTLRRCQEIPGLKLKANAELKRRQDLRIGHRGKRARVR